MEVLSRNHCCHGKAKLLHNVKHSVFESVAIFIQHSMGMHRLMLLFVAFPVLQFFPHYLINNTVFGKKLLNTTCVLIFSTDFEIFLVPKVNESDMTKNIYWATCKVSVILVRF